MTPYILYAWAWYYFIRKVDYRRFKATRIYFLKGIGLGICGNIIANLLRLDALCRYDMDLPIHPVFEGLFKFNKVDMFLATPLIIFSIIKIAKLLNKRDDKGHNNITDEKKSL